MRPNRYSSKSDKQGVVQGTNLQRKQELLNEIKSNCKLNKSENR